ALPEVAVAPFSTLVAEAEVFAAGGELDEALSLLADEEYLLRLALAGLIAAPIPEDTALCGLAARNTSAMSQVADEAKLVLARHETALAERFGRKAAKAYRRKLMHDRNASVSAEFDTGHHGTLATLDLARRLGPPRLARGLAPWARQGVRARSIAIAKRLGTRLLAANALDPAHPAVVAFVRFLTGSGRSSLAAVAPGLAAMAAEGEPAEASRSDGRRPLSAVERSVLTVVHACCSTGKLARAEAILDAHLARDPALPAHPRLIERLATVHLAAGRSERARELLSGALQICPSDDTLRLALADAFARVGKWAEAASQWERVSPGGKAMASAGLRTRLARAYRLTGRPREALAILSQSTVVSTNELGRELDKSLRLCAGWPECLVPFEEFELEAHGRFEGRVDTWGFLAGGREPLTGRLVGDGDSE